MRHALIISGIALLAATVLSGCRTDQQVAESGTQAGSGRVATNQVAELTVPSGTAIDVSLATPITSETAAVGNAWTGSLRNAAVIDGHDIIPAGSTASGTVTAVTPARKGDRAMLNLGLTSITVGDHNYRVRGNMESVIAGSTRARNLGAIGASTVAGAVIGHAVGKSDKGTIVGGLIGAGAAAGVVSQTKGWQVVLKPGTPLTFTTNQSVAVRL